MRNTRVIFHVAVNGESVAGDPEAVWAMPKRQPQDKQTRSMMEWCVPDTFQTWIKDRLCYAQGWKERTSDKAQGHFCIFGPDQIVHADDALLGPRHSGNCHPLSGNCQAQRRVATPKGILKGVGMCKSRG